MKKAFLATVALTLMLIMSPAIAQAHSVSRLNPPPNCLSESVYTYTQPKAGGTLKVEFEVFRDPMNCVVTELLTYSEIDLAHGFSHTGTVNAVIGISTGGWANQNPQTIPINKTEWDTTTTFAPDCGTTYYGYGSASDDGYNWAASTTSVPTEAC